MNRAPAAIYCRISADPEGRELGVQRQEQDCRALAERLGLTVGTVVVENDTSASTRSTKVRPLYADMVRRARAGEFGAVLAYSNSRLTRRPREFEDLLDLFEQRGVRIVTVVSGEDDLGTADGRLMARLKASIDAAEAERTAERVTRAKAQAAAQGLYRGGRRPFGYEADGVTLREDEARALADAAAMILAGRSVMAVARTLNDRGITTTGGKAMDGQSIRRILLRPRNAGLVEQDGRIVGEAAWPAAIDEDTWRGMVAVLTDPARRTTPGPTRRWLLSGIARCSVCKTPLRSHSSPGRAFSYTCPEGSHVARDAAVVDASVREVIVTVLSRQEAAGLLLAAPEDVEPLRDRARALRARLGGFEADYAEGLISARLLRDSVAKVQADLEEVEGRLAAASPARAGATVLDAPDPAQAFLDADLDVQRDVIDVLVQVVIHPGRKGRPKGWVKGMPYVDLTTVEVSARAGR